jgi:hypothetical protein
LEASGLAQLGRKDVEKEKKLRSQSSELGVVCNNGAKRWPELGFRELTEKKKEREGEALRLLLAAARYW